jgi:N-acyl-D-aspartate/D-glutamate deacylase
MLDLKITGGTIVDGSGRARYRGDVGVKDGRITVIGEISEDARETVDATGKIVSPGFIDVHTHYDAQVFWDPALSPSCFHGVTTILGGFCGFSIAPLSKEAAGYLAPMLARVEGMPLETLLMAVPWNWESFSEFLDSFEGKVGLNAGFFAGHSAIRRVVMGERAVGEEATPDELEKMKTLLGESLAGGALGFSTTISVSHNDADGNPVPSRWATHEEIIELGRVTGQHEGTGLEMLPDVDFGPGVKELITDFSIAANRPVNWNALGVDGSEHVRARAARQLAVSDYARERGGEVIALTVPSTPDMFVNFKSGFALDINPGMWREIFKWPVEERIRRLRDDMALRQQLREDLASVEASSMLAFIARIETFVVRSVTAEENKKYEGRVLGDIAREGNRDALDVMLDITVADELTTSFTPSTGGDDYDTFALRAALWKDDRTLIGASDAGAHIDMIDTFAFSTAVLQDGVRTHGVVTLEEAVYQMTDRPARYMGLIDRGLLAPGYHADIVVFDADTVGRGKTYFRFDVPGDQFRTYAEAEGVDHVFVNGVQIVRNGEHTGKLPGTVLRSGRDTRTVALDALREGRTATLLETA